MVFRDLIAFYRNGHPTAQRFHWVYDGFCPACCRVYRMRSEPDDRHD